MVVGFEVAWCGRRVDIGWGEGVICVFEVVVRIRRLRREGRRSLSWEMKVEMGVEAGSGIERVEGRFRPGKEARRMFIVGESILVE